jgi:uncharacterized protein
MLLYLLLFFVVSAIYSSQGLGGIPSLIALLVLLPFTAIETKALALVLSILLVLYMMITSRTTGLGDLTDTIIILGCAAPMAVIGARIQLPQAIYFFTFGVMFVISAISILSNFKSRDRKPTHKGMMILSAGLIGLIVGITGMVGSVFLLPLLYKYKWKDHEDISFFSSLFVLITSGLALVASYRNGLKIDFSQVTWYSIASLAGAILGQKIEITYLNTNVLKNITGIFLLCSGIYFCYLNFEGATKAIEAYVK